MAAEMFVQLSLLAFYLRVFASSLFKTIVKVMMVVVVCFGVANTFTMIFQCTPVQFFWRGWAGEMAGNCININLYSWIRAAIEIAIDVAIIILPIQLNMPNARQLAFVKRRTEAGVESFHHPSLMHGKDQRF